MKYTQLVYSASLAAYLDSWCAYRCSHSYAGHEKVAIGADSAASAAYPEAMTLALAQALLHAERRHSLYSAPGMRSGSTKPHASDAIAAAAVEQARLAGSASMRRLEPELESVLMEEPFPLVNEPVSAPWTGPPAAPAGATPMPLTTAQLIPASMLRRLRTHRVQVAACYEAAARGRWRWAKDHRPPPCWTAKKWISSLGAIDGLVACALVGSPEKADEGTSERAQEEEEIQSHSTSREKRNRRKSSRRREGEEAPDRRRSLSHCARARARTGAGEARSTEASGSAGVVEAAAAQSE